MSTENQYVEECIKAQEKFCREHNLPNFVPENGVCWRCRLNIFGTERFQYTKEKAASNHITSCPLCHRTYCD